MRKLTIVGILALSLMTWSVVAHAGAGCKHSQKASCSAAAKAACGASASEAAALQYIDITTARMPSGAMLVFYTSDKPEVIQVLQEKAAQGPEALGCTMCKKVAADNNCAIELTTIGNGVVALVTAEDASAIDSYEKQFAALTQTDETGQSAQ